ncbi:DNA internalization-related competence protein ComEC/Rec2 [Shewanella sp. 1CM18E]|uniref:DNA internalization-related competence protein ComEC/Rec2 n=1 Tax=Shewanella sp. 1CM18E TaxID=2929169 RepID=UPI0020C12027|nr:DNA internalization-related competence protein ComEC/Rec2 [Shewanella sp. 1CM18E]MCK8046636.1 DNA internalization-related competence protein ComEC/Rec2 [Shewanella sp. 1CM18E]
MNRFMCGYCITIVSTMFWPSLVSLYILPLLIVVVITACRRFPFIAGSLLAIGWFSVFYSLLMSWSTDEYGKALNIEGEIVSLVSSNRDWISVDIVLLGLNSPQIVQSKLRLFWQKPPKVSVGQRWLLTIKPKPKPITSILNQGGFNQQKNFLAKHIIAKGSVISAELIEDSPSYRAQLIAQLKPVLKSYSSGDLILALVSGDKSLISKARWQELRSSGAGHLFAISGLHLSVVSMWLLLLARLILYRLVPINSRRNWLICLLVAGIGAIFYAYLAGFAVSTQRALVMLIGFIVFSAVSRYSSSWERLLYALFIILVIDPLSILSASFWLSFSALAIILLTVSRANAVTSMANATVLTSGAEPDNQLAKQAPSKSYFKPNKIKLYNGLKMFWAVQWRLTIALGIIQAIFFAGTSVTSLLVNMLLVPWFSFVLIPISLLSLVSFMAFTALGLSGYWLFELSALLMEPVVVVLAIVTEFSFSWLVISDELLAVLIVASIGCFLMLNIKNTHWRLVLSVMLLPLIMYGGLRLHSPVINNRWQVHVLDVGQGLAVVIEQNKRAVIYDTGARYGETFSYAERALQPFLVSRGISDVDYLVVSHSDNDHAGGVNYMLASYSSVKVIADFLLKSNTDESSSSSAKTSLRSSSANSSQNKAPNQSQNVSQSQYKNSNKPDKACRPHKLDWQHLQLDFIAPNQPQKGNNGSCVLKVSDDINSLLLTGDIEKQAELALVAEFKDKQLQSRLLIAPHHGSNTSSSAEFIDAVAPELVVFPAGFNNRYGFPKQKVAERYQHRNIPSLTTGLEGQVSIIFNQQSMKVRTYRTDLAPFWYNQVFRFGQMQNPE